MPNKVVRGWVENDKLLLLLDALDEVIEEKRGACVAAINSFRQEHLVSMAVCSRTAHYDALMQPLKLKGTVEIQPLTPEQIDLYVSQVGETAIALKRALSESGDLREIAQKPLMLRIMILAYHEFNTHETALQGSRLSTYKYVFNSYIRQMFKQHGQIETYVPQQTLRWLSWLAKQMIKQGQTLFLVENLHPDWLSSRQAVISYRLSIGFSVGLPVGLCIILGSSLTLRLLSGLSIGLNSSLIPSMLFGLIVGFGIGLIAGLDFRAASYIHHILLRVFLYCEGRIPWDYRRFLNYAETRNFLGRTGESYVFIHRIVMEHFAGLTDEDIERITSGLH